MSNSTSPKPNTARESLVDKACIADNDACLKHLKEAKQYVEEIIENIQAAYNELSFVEGKKWFCQNHQDFRHNCWQINSGLYSLLSQTRFLKEKITTKQIETKD